MPYADPEKRRQYQLAWVKARREAWIAENGPCAQCGSGVELQVDHRDFREKSFDVARVWSYSAARREAELAKCQVLCRPCHEKKTAMEGSALHGLGPLQHGTHGMYVKHGCRCPLCRAAHAEQVREYRARNGLVA